jgi:hypothetical protein
MRIPSWNIAIRYEYFRIEGCVILKKDEKVLRDAWNEMQQRKRERESKARRFLNSFEIVYFTNFLESRRASMEKLETSY